jgi:hypothetical protein
VKTPTDEKNILHFIRCIHPEYWIALWQLLSLPFALHAIMYSSRLATQEKVVH